MQIPENLQTRSIDLASIGCAECAWTRADALELLGQLDQGFHIVLGGDVLSHSPNGWLHNYDSWHFDPDLSQNQESNSALSISEARNYIQNYQAGNYAFVLVLA